MSKRRLFAAVIGTLGFALVAGVVHAMPLQLVRLVVLEVALGAVVESDLGERRVPNLITIPGSVVCGAAWAVSGITRFALVEGLTLVALLLALSLLRPQAFGMGDVKLALLLVAGLDGRGSLALLFGLALAASFGIALVLRHGRAGLSRQLPLAPFFAAGALVALLA
jgi:leader peptidase (prepilin peptidase) / N-methyltransferase